MTKEEAIKIIKDNWPESRHQLSEALQTLIPEFQESEDDKLIKEIISIVKSYRESCITEGNHRFNDCIAWLKKQGKKTISKNINVEALQYVDTCAVDGEVTHGNITEPYWNHHSMIAAYKAGWLEKQSEQKVDKCKDCNNVKGCIICTDGDQYAHITEQKPTDKTEPKFKTGDCIRHKGADECYKIVKMDENYYFCENNHAWNISSQDYFELVEQKSAWSKEDEKKIDLLIAIFEVNHPNEYFKVNPINTPNMEAISTKEIVDWLKSLKEIMKGE